MQFFRQPNINFISKRKLAFVVSSTLILIGIISLVLHKGPNYGIDFKGGTSITLRFEKELSVAQVRSSLSNIGLGRSEIKQFGAPNEILIRVEEQEKGTETEETLEEEEPRSEVEEQQKGTEISDLIKGQLSRDFPDNKFDVRMVEKVGPKIGEELRRAAVWAILIAMLGILVYISWRFEFKFAIGAIAALFHDVLITLGIFSLLNLEISLAIVAAFLTIVGYSRNDTIVVFDRIRENLKVLRREAYEHIVNFSINQSLSRTIMTSLTTLIVVVVLYFFGGEVIHNFAFALIVGVLVGTYSSVFVASPIVVELHQKGEERKERRLMRR